MSVFVPVFLFVFVVVFPFVFGFAFAFFHAPFSVSSMVFVFFCWVRFFLSCLSLSFFLCAVSCADFRALRVIPGGNQVDGLPPAPSR